MFGHLKNVSLTEIAQRFFCAANTNKVDESREFKPNQTNVLTGAKTLHRADEKC